jgi:hypothetical protein
MKTFLPLSRFSRGPDACKSRFMVEGTLLAGNRGGVHRHHGRAERQRRPAAAASLSGAAHEMAHQTGIASENEAEFTAYLACMFSSDPNVRYSGLIYALIVSGNALYQADPDRYLAAAETYSDAIWCDLADYDAYWDSFDGDVRESADKRNDAYLKHNAQESGVKSMGNRSICCWRTRRRTESNAGRGARKMHFFLKMHKFPPPLKRRHHAILCQKTTQNPATAKCSNGFEADTKQKVRCMNIFHFFGYFGFTNAP